MTHDGYCFVPGCNSGYPAQRKEFKKTGKKVPSLFAVKKYDIEMLQTWRKIIPRADKEFHFQNKVCELHFDKNDVIKEFVHKFPDGSIQRLGRERSLLKPGAIPRIFPKHIPTSYEKKKYKRREKDTDISEITENSISTCDNLEFNKDFHLKTYSRPKSSLPKTIKSEPDFSTTVNMDEDEFCNDNHLENDGHKDKEESTLNNSSVSEHIECITHAEAFGAAETLLHYMINQDDVSHDDINSILNIAKKIKQRMFLEKGIAYDNS